MGQHAVTHEELPPLWHLHINIDLGESNSI